MCCHRLYIYSTCGHSTFSVAPLVLCRNAGIAPTSSHSSTCKLVAHPYQSRKIDSLCPTCQWRRKDRLRRVEQCQTISFEEYKWKVSYDMPTYGKDYWMEKTDRREAASKETMKARECEIKRWSWKRSRKGGGGTTPATPVTPRP